ncbi:MAG: hypothetical protein K6E30_09815 [Lachnospiraceae bacterium]|nr:hypothetical protein [Lachnospiraceae bacterium]
MGKASKGEYGYFRFERKRRMILTFIFLGIPLIIFIAGLLLTGTEKSVFTVAAVVLVIPFAMSFTGLVTVFTQKSISDEAHEAISAHAGGLLMAYELYVTHEKASTFVDAFAICGNSVAGLVTGKKGDPAFTQEYVQKTLRAAGFSGISVKLFREQEKFLERLDSMNAHADSLRQGLSYKVDPRYPDYNREELIWQTLLEISF